MTPGPIRFASHRLPAPAQEALERLVRAHGTYGASTLLGCSPSTVDALRGGGRVRPETVARITAKLTPASAPTGA
jgi:hypothetical protein